MPTVTPVAKPLIRNLLIVAKALAKARGISLTTVSREIHGDPPALDNLTNGKGSITLRKYDEAMKRAAAIWPEGKPWPKLKEPVFQPADSTESA